MSIKDKEIEADYRKRINRVFAFIDENLDSDLSLEKVSKIAYFSPFHFHRVFKFLTQETLNKYVNRRRLEKSASDLLHTRLPITYIAYKYGFSDNSSYSRAFKKYFGVSPTEFKQQNPNRHSKIRQLESKNRQVYPESEKYICIIDNLKHWIKMNAKIEIKEMPKMDLAYVSSIGSQNIQLAYNKLMKWARSQGLINEHSKMLTIYHDSFKITAPNKVRMSAAILLNQPAKVEGEVSLSSIVAGKFIVARFEIGLEEFEKSWTGLFVWMNEQGYKKADREPFEIYNNNFDEHPEKKAIVDFCVPIK